MPIASRSALCALLAASACSKPLPELVALPAAPPPAILVRDVAVLDVATGAVERGRDVLTQGDRIAAIAATGSLPSPGDADTVDGRGPTPLPARIASHGHNHTPHGPALLTDV